jgi:N-acetylglucosamine-6-phosphate deacetylase
MKKLFYNAKIVGENGVLQQDSVLVEDGVIVGFDGAQADEKIDCNGGYLFAGFVDIHVHGGGGADFMDGTVETMETVVSTHLSHGTTTIYPTTMSAELYKIQKVFDVFREAKRREVF